MDTVMTHDHEGLLKLQLRPEVRKQLAGTKLLPTKPLIGL